MVVEDSSHLAGTAKAVLDSFDPWVRSGEYIVIDDGILSDMRVAHLYDGGPLRAIEAFLLETADRYEVDRTLCDYFGTNVTWNVNGYLRRRWQFSATTGLTAVNVARLTELMGICSALRDRLTISRRNLPRSSGA